MTSTPFNVGLGDGSRLSSRVLRPPGGGHTDIFGGEPEPPRGRRPAPSTVTQVNEPKQDHTEEPKQNGNGTPEVPQVQAEQETKPEAKTETEKPIAEKPKVEPPKRTRVPPGGFSTGFW